MHSVINWLLEDKDPDVKYRTLTDSFPEPYFGVGTVGQPNKWVTLYVLLAEKVRNNND